MADRATLIAQAIAMISRQDLSHWSDDHDTVTPQALREYHSVWVDEAPADLADAPMSSGDFPPAAVARPAHGGYPGPFSTSPAGRYGGGRYGETPRPKLAAVTGDGACPSGHCANPLACSGADKCVRRAVIESPIARDARWMQTR